MELLYASCVGVLVSCGIFLLLRARTFPVVLGLTMISYAVNLFLFSSGRLTINKAVVLGTGADYADPLSSSLGFNRNCNWFCNDSICGYFGYSWTC